MDDGANSTLFIAKINKADSGNYTCSISEYQNYTIVVHILNGKCKRFIVIVIFIIYWVQKKNYTQHTDSLIGPSNFGRGI